MDFNAWGGVSRNGFVKKLYPIEIKSKFRIKHIVQVRVMVGRFAQYTKVLMKEYEGYEICPILAAVDISDEHRDLLWAEGIHVINVVDGKLFELATPSPADDDKSDNPGPVCIDVRRHQ